VINERELVVKYSMSCDDVDDLEARLKAAKKKKDAIELQLIEHLRSIDAKTTAKYEGIGSVTAVKPRLYASYNQGQAGDVFAWLEEIGRDELIKETVHPSSLSALVKDRLEEGFPPPECVSYYFKESVRINRNKEA